MPASHGWHWVRDGWRLVLRKPITWLAFSAITWLIIGVSSLHPLLMAAVAVLLPVILAGWALACREAEAGRPIPVTMLFEGFRGRVGLRRPARRLQGRRRNARAAGPDERGARAVEATLVTRDRAFLRVPEGLRVETWLE